tara:strand:+ start:49 stop:618 length:570 start_codon:yes stop_codon:yes gene_type:complete
MNILIIGPPGVGKGTQAKLIKDKLGLIHLSTGELLREEIKSKSEVGIISKRFINKGEFIPDDIMLEIIDKRITKYDCLKGYLFDGFPRTIAQAKGLDIILSKYNCNVDTAISLTADIEELKIRLLKRSHQDNRSDDLPSIINKRQKIYWIQTAPILKYYEAKNLLKEVDGLGSIKHVNKRILNIFNSND